MSAEQEPADAGRETSDLQALRDENQTLYSVIKSVSSSLELAPMLQRIVELATDATDCHACFIYLLEDGELTIRAASPVFADAVGNVSFSVHEGLTGWVARHRTPEFIRERAMDDPRMKYIDSLREEEFQSMAAVPILSRAGETIGVIVLHTRAPREFSEDVLNLMRNIASLVSGAIENAQSYDRERQRVGLMTGLSGLAQEVTGASDTETLGLVVTRGVRSLLSAATCRLYLIDRDSGELEQLALAPDDGSSIVGSTAADLLLDSGGMLVVPLNVGDERVGLLCVEPVSGRTVRPEESEIARAVAHLTALAIRRVQLIDQLTKANTVKDLFEALGAGAATFAARRAAEIRCDMSLPYVLICAEPTSQQRTGSGKWREVAEALARGLEPLAPRSAIEAGPGPVRAILSLPSKASQRLEEVLRAARALGAAHDAVLGLSGLHRGAGEGPRAFREAVDASKIGRALLSDGGAISYSDLGAYRYLVQISPEDTPRDRMSVAVEVLIDYDSKRRTALLDTLERYLAERRSVIESARELYIHPNTLRQRLSRIEELTGLDLDHDDLLSLELAIKLSRLHRVAGSDASSGAR